MQDIRKENKRAERFRVRRPQEETKRNTKAWVFELIRTSRYDINNIDLKLRQLFLKGKLSEKHFLKLQEYFQLPKTKRLVRALREVHEGLFANQKVALETQNYLIGLRKKIPLLKKHYAELNKRGKLPLSKYRTTINYLDKISNQLAEYEKGIGKTENLFELLKNSPLKEFL